MICWSAIVGCCYFVEIFPICLAMFSEGLAKVQATPALVKLNLDISLKNYNIKIDRETRFI